MFGDEAGKQYRRCANFATASGNWMVPAPREGDEPGFTAQGLAPGFCLSCSATRTIPDLSLPGNDGLWRKLEQPKRRLMSQLLALSLPCGHAPRRRGIRAGLRLSQQRCPAARMC